MGRRKQLNAGAGLEAHLPRLALPRSCLLPVPMLPASA